MGFTPAAFAFFGGDWGSIAGDASPWLGAGVVLEEYKDGAVAWLDGEVVDAGPTEDVLAEWDPRQVDDATAQKALDALAKGGFHGKTESTEVTIKDDSGAKKGKVQSLTVTGIHNCCNSCNNAIEGVLQKVDGVKGNTATPKMDSFEVTGDFDAVELIKALNDAGFHVKIKQ